MTENQSLGRIYTQITETGVTFRNLFMILQQNVMLNNVNPMKRLMSTLTDCL